MSQGSGTTKEQLDKDKDKEKAAAAAEAEAAALQRQAGTPSPAKKEEVADDQKEKVTKTPSNSEKKMPDLPKGPDRDLKDTTVSSLGLREHMKNALVKAPAAAKQAITSFIDTGRDLKELLIHPQRTIREFGYKMSNVAHNIGSDVANWYRDCHNEYHGLKKGDENFMEHVDSRRELYEKEQKRFAAKDDMASAKGKEREPSGSSKDEASEDQSTLQPSTQQLGKEQDSTAASRQQRSHTR